MQEIRQEFLSWLQGKERFMLREYLQYIILHLIYTSPYAKKLQFIWWTALRIFHNTQRFSEDLDFDNTGLTTDEFMNLMKICVQWLKLYGFDVEHVITQKWAMHGYIKFIGLLSSFGFAPATRREVQEKLVIRIDTHDQWFDFVPEKKVLKGFGMQTVVQVAPASLLMSHKILTIWERKRAKGRDYYDLVYLMAKNVLPDYKFLHEQLGISTGQEVKEYLQWVISDKNLDALQNDVRPFLFHPHNDSVKNFAIYLKEYDFGGE